MDNERDNCCLEKNCIIFSKAVDVEGEYQETLPAYLDDVYRVVKCTSNSYITSADISFNEVKIYGKTDIRITYYNESSNLCYADFEEEFSKVLTVDNLSDTSFVKAEVSNKYTNFRVINQRRIDIHTMSVLHISVFDKVSYPAVCALDNAKYKSEIVRSSDVFGTYIDKIDFDEEVTIPSESKAIGKIISSNAYSNVDDIKVIKDKLFIKVNLNVSLLYTTDGDEELSKAEYTFNLSKIIDKSGIDDGDTVIADADVGAIFCKVKGNSNEEVSLINIFGDIALNLTFIRDSEQEIIADGYLLGADSTCEYSTYSANTDGVLLNESKLVSVPVEFNNDISKIEELSVVLKQPSYRDGKIITSLVATAIVNSDSGLSSMNANADFEIATERFDDAIVSVGIEKYDFTLSDGGRVDLRLTLKLSAYLFNNKEMPILSEITVGDDITDTHTLTVYFGKEKEKIWDIAKMFLSDENEIIRENSLKGDVLDSPKVLIIPRVQEVK